LVRRPSRKIRSVERDDEMALDVERVVDGGVHAEKTLGGASRLEPLHFALSSWLPPDASFRPIVIPQPRLVRTGQPHTPERRGIRAQPVDDQQFGCEPLILDQLTHQPQRRPDVASTLNQYVEALALMVDGTPQIAQISA
jgi:hypothetical protein